MDHGKQSIQYWNLSICAWVVVHLQNNIIRGKQRVSFIPNNISLKKISVGNFGKFCF
jgi:hypothetical protein